MVGRESKQTSGGESSRTRVKRTTPDDTLAPVSELIADSNATMRYTNLDGELVVADFRDDAARDSFRIPMPIDREGYGTVEHSASYWSSGLGDWWNVCEAVDRFAMWRNTIERRKLLDFGCASGRFLRHAYTHGEADWDVFGLSLIHI